MDAATRDEISCVGELRPRQGGVPPPKYILGKVGTPVEPRSTSEQVTVVTKVIR